jgi:PiT family inorganic phosphate transporter
MTVSTLVLSGLGFGLAYVNGANDVSKGIATLVGSGVTDYQRAILWGSAWTAVGAILAAVLAGAMVATFGNGLLAAGTAPTLVAAIATLLGATLWVLVATRTGLPVSTTHAIVGSLAGVAAVADGSGGVDWSVLGAKILVPLLASPVVSLAAVVTLLRARAPGAGSAVEAADCLCADAEPAVLAFAPGRAMAAMTSGLRLSLVTGTRETCAVERPRALRLTLDHLHWLTSGATSFARGMNDAPKIVALVLAASALPGSGTALPAPALFGLVAAGMFAGSLVAGRRVTHVLAEKVTPMNHREGFLANLVTACLVTTGAALGLPMSTTHVASGGIVGAGAERASLNRSTLRDMALAWAVTLPASAALGIAAYGVGSWVAS